MAARPTESAALRAFELLTGSSATAADMTLGRFEPGNGSTDTVCHLHHHISLLIEFPFTFNDESLSLDLPVVVELFLSRSGSELLSAAAKRRKFYANPRNTFPEVMAIFAELQGDAEEGAQADLLPGQVFRVLQPQFDGFDSEEIAKEILNHSPVLVSRFPPLIGMSREEFKERVLEAAEESNEPSDTIDRQVHKLLAKLLDYLAAAANKIAHFLENNSRMPEEVWNSAKRPQDVTDFLQTTSDALTQAIEDAIAWLENNVLTLDDLLGPLAEVSVIADLKRNSEALWNRPREFLVSVARDIQDILGSAGDSIDALIGYVCGLWDGIMEAIIGFSELIALALKLAAQYLRANIRVGGVIDVVREVIDEVVQALTRIDWIEFWSRFMKEVVPLIIDLIKQKATAFLDQATRNTAVASYYFGYLVYTIAEFFFPPLELGKIARATRLKRATHSAQFFAKVYA